MPIKPLICNSITANSYRNWIIYVFQINFFSMVHCRLHCSEPITVFVQFNIYFRFKCETWKLFFLSFLVHFQSILKNSSIVVVYDVCWSVCPNIDISDPGMAQLGLVRRASLSDLINLIFCGKSTKNQKEYTRIFFLRFFLLFVQESTLKTALVHKELNIFFILPPTFTNTFTIPIFILFLL